LVGAGSVVTRSFPKGNVVIAGNPARPICTLEEFRAKKQHICVNLDADTIRQNKREYLLSLPENMLEKK
jgi:serine acetyltransferase